MVELSTPLCDFGKKPHDFNLLGVDGSYWTLEKCMGKNGLLVMFICNHCPYVLAIVEKLVVETDVLAMKGMNTVAIMPNDTVSYPDDSYENMQKISKKYGFGFPYLYDESQKTTQSYGAICTPDFFGYNSDNELQYRGRFDDRGPKKNNNPNQSDLFRAMFSVARTKKGPTIQQPSIGCSIKWRK